VVVAAASIMMVVIVVQQELADLVVAAMETTMVLELLVPQVWVAVVEEDQEHLHIQEDSVVLVVAAL
jgi:hypothetical protein